MGKIQKLKKQRKIEKELKQEQKQKSRKKKDTIIIAVLLLIVITIGVIFYISRINKDKNIIRVIIETEKGDIKLELYKDMAPDTVDNFVKLTNEDFYNGTTFHRVIDGFVIQGGDPLSRDDDLSNDGTGGPGYVFENEINPKSLKITQQEIAALENQGYVFDYTLESIPHEPGVISMANAGPNSNGSQFFIVTDNPQPHLNGKHTVFGRVYEGMDVVHSIEQNDIMNNVYIID